MKKLIVLDIVGLSKKQYAEIKPQNISKILEKGSVSSFKPSFPAVTCSVQASIFSGTYPSEHGIISNGYYDQILKHVSFWEQSSDLVNSPRIWDTLKKILPDSKSGLLFLQNSLYANSDVVITPKPIHLDDKMIMWCYSKPENFYEKISESIGNFDLKSYWGPFSSIQSSNWIINSAKKTIETHKPDLLIVYLPHLDYTSQKFGPDSDEFKESVMELDNLLGDFSLFLNQEFNDEYEIIILSEYTFNSVSKSISPNLILRQAGLLSTRRIEGKDYIDYEFSKAFAMVDHQIAHIYINPGYEDEVYQILKNKNLGIILDSKLQKELKINHSKSGNLILCANTDSWFNYYWWDDVKYAPDFTFGVDIHRKPGYDPLELFFDFKTKQISHDTSLIKGSHGLIPTDDNLPLIGTSFNSNLDKIVSAIDIKQLIMNFFK
ncbi:alkaline phosphatase family protein [Nitrosopumilus sp.]|nr:alkaline phosphatase family protein [Nitrosopumilus sp.]